MAYGIVLSSYVELELDLYNSMDNVIKKTNLGIAVQEAISELGLDREKIKIMGCLQRCF
jgi:hypothetical protein